MRRASDRRGFTLIELLVVVAIIALLISILLPSLRRARMQAKSAVCLSNLKTIGSAMTMYEGDHRGWLPVGPADKLSYRDREGHNFLEPGPNRRPFPWSNCHWGGKRAAYIHHFDVFGPALPETLKRPLTDYLYRGAGLDAATPAFQCPDDVGTPLYTNPIGPNPVYDLCGNSYYINPWAEYRFVGKRRFKAPSAIVLAEEAPMFFNVWFMQQGRGWHGRFSTHNMLFLDFHADTKYVDTRSYHGPGWFIENYFDIMDYYAY